MSNRNIIRKEFSGSKLFCEQAREYNSLEDQHLSAYFSHPGRKRFLIRMGLIDRYGNIIFKEQQKRPSPKKFKVKTIKIPELQTDRFRASSSPYSNPQQLRELNIKEQQSAERKIREKEYELGSASSRKNGRKIILGRTAEKISFQQEELIKPLSQKEFTSFLQKYKSKIQKINSSNEIKDLYYKMPKENQDSQNISQDQLKGMYIEQKQYKKGSERQKQTSIDQKHEKQDESRKLSIVDNKLIEQENDKNNGETQINQLKNEEVKQDNLDEPNTNNSKIVSENNEKKDEKCVDVLRDDQQFDNRNESDKKKKSFIEKE